MKCWSYSCSIWNRFGWKEILQKSPDISNKSNILNASHPVLVDSFFFPLFAGFYRFQVVHGFQPWIFDFKAKTEDPSEATLDTQPGSNENRWICCFKKCVKYFLKLISWLHPESFYLLLYFAGSYFQIISLSIYIGIQVYILCINVNCVFLNIQTYVSYPIYTMDSFEKCDWRFRRQSLGLRNWWTYRDGTSEPGERFAGW